MTMTNATKAQIIVAINALLAVAAAFGVPLGTENQQAAIALAINAVLGVIVAFTYKDSSKRIPDNTQEYDDFSDLREPVA